MGEAHEFVEGCIDLRGFARKVDITMLQRDNKAFLEKLDDLSENLANEIKANREEVQKNREDIIMNRAEVKKNRKEFTKNRMKNYKGGSEQPNRLKAPYADADEMNEIDEMMREGGGRLGHS